MRPNGSWKLWTPVIASVVVMFLGACASTPPPDEALARAEAQIRTARQDGAADAAPLPLRKAEDHLQRAKQAARDERYDEARRHAEKARADAELASAEAEREHMREAVTELEETVRALEGEITHDSPQ